MNYLKNLGADWVVNRSDPNYMDTVKSLNDGKGPDIIYEMLANVNLNKDFVNHQCVTDLQNVINKEGQIILIGNRGSIEINPRDIMTKGVSIKGITLFNQTVWM